MPYKYANYVSISLEKGYLLVRLKRCINDKINGYFSNVKDLFIRFLDIGINELCTTILGIDNRIFYNNIRALDLHSLEVARELIHFDKHKPPFIPISRYGRDIKRGLGHIGFTNYSSNCCSLKHSEVILSNSISSRITKNSSLALI